MTPAVLREREHKTSALRYNQKMKFRIAILIVLLFSLFCIKNQGTPSKQSEKVWILFTDRIMQQQPAAPSNLKTFTRAAIARRWTRADAPFDESDLPVQSEYVNAVRKAGAKILMESRWLHGVSARCNFECRRKVKTFDFVKEIRPVLTYRRPLEPVKPEMIQTESSNAKALKYGLSKDQLVQIAVPSLHKKGYAGQGEIVAIFDSGFRKDHIAFKNQTIVAERDFVFGDDNVTNGGSTDSHGTSTWSCVGGLAPGKLYGPAYLSQFLLAATEDIRSETIVEEDNWVAAFEWADRFGASVINSSLGYSDWYGPGDYNGETAITSRIVTRAAKKGIVVVNSAGNGGPETSTLRAPADAKNMIAVGAVNFSGLIADFSSRGPTADGRIKPEVVARGLSTYLATSNSATSFGRANGTSFSSPLVAGAVAVLLSAHPDWKPSQVREALLATASRNSAPDNTYGWGIVNLFAASEFLPRKSVVIDQHKPLKNTSNQSKAYRVIARIRAERDINPAQSFLFWKKQGDAAFQQAPFTAVAAKADYFEALIPPQQQGTTVLYYLTARDKKGKRGTLPITAPATPYSFRIL
jgi:subtilisin family serine protease